MTRTGTSKFTFLDDHALRNPTARTPARDQDIWISTVRVDAAKRQNPTRDYSTERTYPIQVNLEYRLAGELESAPGTTVSISSRRVLFKTKHPIPAGSKIEAFVVWPARPDNAIDLRLHIQGEAVGTEKEDVVIVIYRYRFRMLSPNGPGPFSGTIRQEPASW